MTTLEHVLWIGGASTSGKTTIATRLARRHGLRWYSADAHTWEHRDLAIAAGHEGAVRWESMTHEERRATLVDSPAELVTLNLDFERGPMIVDDLRRLPAAPLIVADGSTILPELVAQGHADRDRAVWLLPTFERHRTFHEAQGLGHLVEYRWLIVEEVERQAAEVGVNVLRVDGVGIDEALARVEGLFADAIEEGPRAETTGERHALLRYANEAIMTQARGYLARPWATGDEATFMREFRCECEDSECSEVVALPVADYAAGVSAHV
jgi:hypothetical protein